MNQPESGIFLVKFCKAETNLFLTPASSHLAWMRIWVFVSDLRGSMVTFSACTRSDEYSNRRMADGQALLRSHVMHSKNALKILLRDKNYGEKNLPKFFFLP